jgi:hypothetical protein
MRGGRFGWLIGIGEETCAGMLRWEGGWRDSMCGLGWVECCLRVISMEDGIGTNIP